IPKPGAGSADVHLDPFPYGWIDGYLPRDLYDRLDRHFVMPGARPAMDTLKRGKKRVAFILPDMPEHLLDLDADWLDYLRALGRPDFLQHCLDWAKALVPLDSLPAGPYRELFRLRQALRAEDVELYCEFSSIDDAAFLPPHSDAPDKILSFVHYFAQADWDQAWGGGTEIYRPRRIEQSRNFSNFFLSRDEVDLAGSCAFAPNRLFFFAKTDRSWHGVSPLAAETRLPRRSFNFSLRIRPDAKIDPAFAMIAAQIQADERGAFTA
ncbi:MAG: 2OG-Fe(II) oxygenase, partial [Novosphingobium sp.]